MLTEFLIGISILLMIYFYFSFSREAGRQNRGSPTLLAFLGPATYLALLVATFVIGVNATALSMAATQVGSFRDIVEIVPLLSVLVAALGTSFVRRKMFFLRSAEVALGEWIFGATFCAAQLAMIGRTRWQRNVH